MKKILELIYIIIFFSISVNILNSSDINPLMSIEEMRKRSIYLNHGYPFEAGLSLGYGFVYNSSESLNILDKKLETEHSILNNFNINLSVLHSSINDDTIRYGHYYEKPVRFGFIFSYAYGAQNTTYNLDINEINAVDNLEYTLSYKQSIIGLGIEFDYGLFEGQFIGTKLIGFLPLEDYLKYFIDKNLENYSGFPELVIDNNKLRLKEHGYDNNFTSIITLHYILTKKLRDLNIVNFHKPFIHYNYEPKLTFTLSLIMKNNTNFLSLTEYLFGVNFSVGFTFPIIIRKTIKEN